MKARPLLFSGPMIRALLEGRKTQTRRIVKPQPTGHHWSLGPEYTCGYRHLHSGIWQFEHRIKQNPQPDCDRWIRCPYGQPGDLLWVRETWMDLQGTGVEYRPNPDSALQRYAYCADSPPGSSGDEARKDFGLRWRPSIHMPRAASRLTLRITDVRVERLHDISEEDAQAEGVDWDNADGIFYYVPGILPHSITAVEPTGEDRDRPKARCFQKLWRYINGFESWRANPYVWAITFQPVLRNVDQVLQQPRAAA